MKKSSADLLGSAFYLNRIRSMAIKAYSTQIAIMVGIGFFLALTQGASLKPFYLPLEYFMYVVYIMLFAMFFEIFFFTDLEIRNQDSDAAAYFTSKKASKTSIKVMVAAIVLLVIVANPISEQFLEEKSTTTSEYIINGSNITFEMTSLDRFGLIYHSVEITGEGSGTYNCYLMYKDYYHEGIKDPSFSSRLRFINQSVSKSLNIIPPDLNFDEYVVLIVPNDNATGKLTVSFQNDVKDNFVISTAIFLIGTAIVYAWWFVYLQRYIKKYGTELVSV